MIFSCCCCYRRGLSSQVVAAGAGVASIPFLLGGANGMLKDRAAAAKARGDAAAAAKAGVAAPASAAEKAGGKASEGVAAPATAPLPLPPGTVRLREAAFPLVLTMGLVASVVRCCGFACCFTSMRRLLQAVRAFCWGASSAPLLQSPG